MRGTAGNHPGSDVGPEDLYVRDIVMAGGLCGSSTLRAPHRDTTTHIFEAVVHRSDVGGGITGSQAAEHTYPVIS